MPNKEKINKELDKIRSSTDNIEEEIEDKKVSTKGDPIVEFH